jgi:response regulator RpfG family c-di-GMP phosphodiesterase
MIRVKSKSQLVEWISGVQIVLLACALAGFGWWVKSNIGGLIRAQIIDANQVVAEQIGRLLRTIESEEITFGDANWERFQSIVEETKLPNNGYLCIADASSGQLLCHPKIRLEPSLRDARLDKVIARSLSRNAINLFQSALDNTDQHRPSTGVVGSGDKTEVISAALLQNIGAVLFVHQSESSTNAAVSTILTPVSLAGLVTGVILIVVTAKSSTFIIKGFEHTLVSINEGLEQTVRNRTESLMKTRNSVIFGLAKLAESRDSDTGEHLDRIRLFSSRLAEVHASRCDEIDPHCIESIGLASSLHDIGKVGVPDSVLLKPGKLDALERIEIQRHPALGEKCLDAIDRRLGEDRFLELAREICAYHHEKWDGSGYPYGKRGRDIPIAARIVALADVYDALRSKRPYKEAMSHNEACRIIAQGAGTHFDPAIVESFIDVHREFEAISNRYLERHQVQLRSIPIEKDSCAAVVSYNTCLPGV